MNEVLTVLKDTGLLTTVGGSILTYYCIANLRGKIKLSWYAFVPFIPAYALTGIYFAVFGSRIVTAPMQTLLYIFLGSHILTTVLCLILFFKKSVARPRHEFPWTSKRVVAAFAMYAIFLMIGVALFFALVVNDHCDGWRCRSAQLLAGRFGVTGTLTFSAFWMGSAAMWLNLLCYIYHPYIPPQEEVKKE